MKSSNATAFGYILTWKEVGFIPIIKHNISLKTCASVSSREKAGLQKGSSDR